MHQAVSGSLTEKVQGWVPEQMRCRPEIEGRRAVAVLPPSQVVGYLDPSHHTFENSRRLAPVMGAPAGRALAHE